MNVKLKDVVCLQETSLPRVFKLFRALGLRHLVVVDDENRVRVCVSVSLCVIIYIFLSLCASELFMYWSKSKVLIALMLLDATVLRMMFLGVWPSAGGWTGDQERLGQISPWQTRTGGTSAGSDIVHTRWHESMNYDHLMPRQLWTTSYAA